MLLFQGIKFEKALPIQVYGLTQHTYVTHQSISLTTIIYTHIHTHKYPYVSKYILYSSKNLKV